MDTTTLRVAGLALCATMLCACERAQSQGRADIIFINGAIITLDPDVPRAEALAILDGLILAVGQRDSIDALRDPATEVVDLQGGALLPGFHDSHVHPIKGGLQQLQCSLSGLDSVEAILTRVAACDSATADDGGWLVGRGWSLGLFPQGNPHRTLIDEVVAGRPVYLEAEDGHSAWVNTEALRVAGLDRGTPDPQHGVIEREAGTGEPSGTLRESAKALIEALLPPIDAHTRLQALQSGVRAANHLGITSIVDASVGPDELAAYRALAASAGLTVRVTAAIEWSGDDDGAQLELLLRQQAADPIPGLRLGSVKIFVDGVLEGDTAALLDPYRHREAEYYGELLHAPHTLATAIARFDAMDLDVHLHAIGDRAVQAALDAIAVARATNSGLSHGRHQIAHLQLVHQDDYPRFADLDVAANFQALWAYPDSYIVDINLPQVGMERVERMYPLGSLARAGARIVAGSDWPVSSLNPWNAIEVALTRQDPRGRHPGVLNAREAVNLDTMIAAYTREGAWAARAELVSGMLRPGLEADLVWLDRDPYGEPATGIADIRVRGTWFAGTRVYDAAD